MPGVAPRMLAASSGSCSSAEIWISVLHSIDYKQNMHECVCVQWGGKLKKFFKSSNAMLGSPVPLARFEFPCCISLIARETCMSVSRHSVLLLAPQPPVWSCAEPSNSSDMLSSGSLISLSFAWIMCLQQKLAILFLSPSCRAPMTGKVPQGLGLAGFCRIKSGGGILLMWLPLCQPYLPKISCGSPFICLETLGYKKIEARRWLSWSFPLP